MIFQGPTVDMVEQLLLPKDFDDFILHEVEKSRATLQVERYLTHTKVLDLCSELSKYAPSHPMPHPVCRLIIFPSHMGQCKTRDFEKRGQKVGNVQ